MKKISHWEAAGQGILILLAVVMLLRSVSGSGQATPSFYLPQKFEGEYSRDGITWQKLEENTRLSSLEEDLFLRGSFVEQNLQDFYLFFYLDHIFFSVSINGDPVIQYMPESAKMERDMCGNQWYYKWFDSLKEEDLIEIHLYNPHMIGNQNAYRSFLDSVYIDSLDTVSKFLMNEGKGNRGIGLFLIVIAIILLGLSLAYFLMRVPDENQLWAMSMFSLFMGGFIFLNTKDVFFWNEKVAFNTYALEICQILGVFFAGMLTVKCLTAKVWNTGCITIFVSGLLDGVLIFLCLFQIVGICKVVWIWETVQIIICILLTGCAGYEWVRKKQSFRDKTKLLACFVMLTAVFLDQLGDICGWWDRGTCQMPVFIILLVCYLAEVLWTISANYLAAQEAEKMERELQEKNLTMMISQIQPHFIYNSLNAIRHLCKGVPEAQQAIRDFSDYLRGNLNSIDRRTPVPFQTELKHIRSYLSLEKMRFEDELNIVYDIQTVNFSLPALTVQPLLENAVKHGVGQTPEGGTVTLATREDAEYFEIIISDNGVGFDPSEPLQDGKKHVGIENVKYRLWNMCHATLQITSEIGKGTKAVIRLPKEDS